MALRVNVEGNLNGNETGMWEMELSATDQWLHDDAVTLIIRQLI